MTKFLLTHTCKSGLQLTAFEDGSIRFQDDTVDLHLTDSEVDELVRLLERAHARIQEPRVEYEPPPFALVQAVVFQGADGPEMVVDLAEQLKEMAVRNARLMQDLAALEDCRDRLSELLSVRNGQA